MSDEYGHDRTKERQSIAPVAEQQICTWSLQLNEWVDKAPFALTGAHFSSAFSGAALGPLFDQIVALRAKGMSAKPDTIEGWGTARGDWTIDKLLALMSLGRCGSFDEYVSNGRAIIDAANGRKLQRALKDAAGYVNEHLGEEDPRVLHGKACELVQGVDMGASNTVKGMADLGDEYFAEIEAGKVRSYTTDYWGIDKRHGSFMGGDLIFVAGEPGSGKTTLLTNIARRFARKGHVVHFASYEMTGRQLTARNWSAISYAERDVDPFAYTALRNPKNVIARATLVECQRIAKERYRTLRFDVAGAQSVGELEAAARNSRMEHDGRLDAVFVDFLQAMRPTSKSPDRHTQVAEIGYGLKNMAVRLDVPVFVSCTINREFRKRKDPRPCRSDLGDSGKLEYACDAFLGVYRPARDLQMELEAAERDGAEPDELTIIRNKIKAREHDLEIVSDKVRNGPEGIDALRCHLPFDTISDYGRPYLVEDEAA